MARLVDVVFAIAAKDLRLLWRDRAGALLAFVWPLVIAVFIGALGPGMAGDPDIDSTFAISFPQGMIWGVLSCSATFGISLVNERREGTLARLHSAPLHPGVVMAGKTLACLISALMVELLVFSVGVAAFGLRPTSWPVLVLAMLALPVALCGLTTLLAALARTARSASGMTWAVLMSLAMAGGAMVPLVAMPDWVQQGALMSPVSWGLYALEGGLWRGFGVGDALPYLAALVGFGATCMVLGARAFAPR